MSAVPVLKVCEFYSGLGGYHLALSHIPDLRFNVVAAFEISSNANLIYRHNFPDTKVLETNLCGLTAARLDSLIGGGDVMKSRVLENEMTSPDDVTSTSSPVLMTSPVLFVMSPPCQPFTRQGAKKDDLDPRSESVLHLFDIFSDLKSLPDYFFLENVQGFETSNTRNKILAFLDRHGYHVLEFLVNSNTLGIPNSRLRYYLLARREPFTQHSSESSHILSSIPGIPENVPPPPLSTFLETDPKDFEISERFLSKWGWVLDIVTPDSNRSCCFTKGYSVKAEGAGSVIQRAPDDKLGDNSQPENDQVTRQDNERSLSNSTLQGEEFVEHMKSLRLRYFTPREIARIHGIPEWYVFPPALTNRQLYKLLGNGLSVTVVSILLESVLLKGSAT